MNGNNPIENRLNELFAKAKQQEPLLSNTEVHTLLTHAPTSAFPGKQLVHFIHNHLKIIIMSTIVSTILISFFFWGSFFQNKQGIIAQKEAQILPMKVEKTSVSTIPENTGKNIFIPTKQEKLPLSNSTENFHTIVPNQSGITDTTGSEQKLPECNQQFSGDEFILSLTIDEFCKLGFSYNDSMFYHLNQSPDSIISGFVKWLSQPPFGKSQDLRSLFGDKAIYLYNAKIPFTNNTYYPVCCTDRYKIQGFPIFPQLKSDFEMNLKKYPVEFNQPIRYPSEIIDTVSDKSNSSGVVEFNSSKLSEYMHYLHSTNNYNFKQSNFDLINDTLIPVTIYYKTNDTINNGFKLRKQIAENYSEQIFWFKYSDSFYNALPLRYNNSVKEFYEKIKAIKNRSKCIDKDIVDYSSISLLKRSIAPLKKVELSSEDLKRLGIIVDSTSIEYCNKLSNATVLNVYVDKNNARANIGSGIPQYQYSITNEKIKFDSHFHSIEAVPENDFYPAFVSGTNGSRPTQWHCDATSNGINSNMYFSDIFFLERINRLLAIVVKKDSIKTLLNDDLIFWFTPTEALFDSLPARYANDLRNEYRALLLRTDPNIPQAIKDKAPAVCTYFEECRPTYPDISDIKVFPNPAKNIVNIDFNLNKPDKVRIILFDIEGRPMKILKDSELVSEGYNQLQVSVENLPDGIYILSIQNNDGNYKTQRIIKQ